MEHQDRIINVAARLFRERGVDGTTVRAIADEAGLLLGSLTYRYPTKETLVVAMMERAAARAAAAVRRATETSRDPVERLRLALRAHLRLLLCDEDAVYVLLFDWTRLSEATRAAIVALRDQYEALWDGLVHEAAGSGQLAPGLDLKLVRMFAFGAANSVAQWYRPGGPRTPEEIADAYSALIGYGVMDSERRPADPGATYRRLSATQREDHD